MKKSLLTTVLLVAGILLMINVLSKRFFLRFDLTENKEFTLSKATKEVLQNLENPITITAYFSENLPTNIAKVREDFKDLLTEYAQISKGKVNYQFVSPNEDPKVEQEAMQNGIQPVMINVREKDEARQQKAYLGAVLAYGEQKDILPVIQPGAAMEYALTTSIKKIAVTDKPFIGLLTGYGAAGPQELGQVLQELSVLYQVEPIDMMTMNEIPSKYRTIALVRPMDSIGLDKFHLIDDFMISGGNLVLAFDQVSGDMQSLQGTTVNNGIALWLSQKGITVQNAFITDASCGQISVQQSQGFFSFQSAMEFPYLPLVNAFTDHPITKGIEQVIFQFASPMTPGNNATPIVESSAKSGIAQLPVFFDINKNWTHADFNAGAQTIGISYQPAQGGGMIVFSDGDFPIGGQRRRANADNINLFVNSIDYLSDDTGLIDLRTKSVATRPIEDLEDGRRSFLKYLNFFLPIALVLLYGFYRSQRNKNRRMKLMQDRFVG